MKNCYRCGRSRVLGCRLPRQVPVYLKKTVSSGVNIVKITTDLEKRCEGSRMEVEDFLRNSRIDPRTEHVSVESSEVPSELFDPGIELGDLFC